MQKRMQKKQYAELRGLIKTHYDTQQAYADALGITNVTLSNKLNGNVQFRQDEISRTKEVFGLTPEQVDAIFFAK